MSDTLRIIGTEAKIEFSVTLKLTEKEADLLYQISCFSPDAVKDALEKHLGRSYLAPPINSLAGLFKVFGGMGESLRAIKTAREGMNAALLAAKLNQPTR